MSGAEERGLQVGSTVKNMIDFFEGHRRRTGVDDTHDQLSTHTIRPDQHSVADCQSFVAGRTALPSVATKVEDHEQDHDLSSHRRSTLIPLSEPLEPKAMSGEDRSLPPFAWIS